MKFIVNGAIAGLAIVAGLLMHLPSASAAPSGSCTVYAQNQGEYNLTIAEGRMKNVLLDMDQASQNNADVSTMIELSQNLDNELRERDKYLMSVNGATEEFYQCYQNQVIYNRQLFTSIKNR